MKVLTRIRAHIRTLRNAAGIASRVAKNNVLVQILYVEDAVAVGDFLWTHKLLQAGMRGNFDQASALLDTERIRNADAGTRLAVASCLFIGAWHTALSNPEASKKFRRAARRHFTTREFDRARPIGVLVTGVIQGWLYAEEHSDVATKIYADSELLTLINRTEVDKWLTAIKLKPLPAIEDGKFLYYNHHDSSSSW